jgi:UDP-3-O-[3-hydroxymyristoyl] N-acetylglucosamine deacetylase
MTLFYLAGRAVKIKPHLIVKQRKQRTLQRPVSYSGIGIHKGNEVHMRFCPAEPGTGICFQRTDLPDAPLIPARVGYVLDTSRSTNIGIGSVRVHTVEHVMAALRAYQIDNLIIQVSEGEPPAANGNSQAFLEMIEEAGIEEQDQETFCAKIDQPIYWSQGDIHLVALPAEEYRISYTLYYPQAQAIRSQYFSFLVESGCFKREIAPCRTFALYHELSMLLDAGLIKGGSLDNAVVIKDDVVFSKEGLMFPDEMVRHKILDMIGDLSLLGFEFVAHIIAIRSGHNSNYAFAQKLLNHMVMETS